MRSQVRSVNVRDSIGQRGEAIFQVLLTKFHGRIKPIFRPQFLGDKWPAVDFIVELMNYRGKIVPYFFVQVKTTRQGYTKKQNRLKVRVSASDAQRLALLPAPTYIIGIDEINERGYIISANGQYRKSLRSLSTQFPINKSTQNTLWMEVQNYWNRFGTLCITSKFIDPAWR
jgi:hypothetical protein